VVQALLNECPADCEVQRQIERWRARAQELRTAADRFAIPSAQDTLSRIAANYDALADDAEARLARSVPNVKPKSP